MNPSMLPVAWSISRDFSVTECSVVSVLVPSKYASVAKILPVLLATSKLNDLSSGASAAGSKI